MSIFEIGTSKNQRKCRPVTVAHSLTVFISTPVEASFLHPYRLRLVPIPASGSKSHISRSLRSIDSRVGCFSPYTSGTSVDRRIVKIWERYKSQDEKGIARMELSVSKRFGQGAMLKLVPSATLPLTFSKTLVTVRITHFNLHQICILPTQYLYVCMYVCLYVYIYIYIHIYISSSSPMV